ncbi:MAG: RNA polymerase sigma-70 factor [Prolixibacteraceae bacterium]|nr:RNA polymerase sigma-70 factor [Prolixibacteraceae bacterium]
MSLSIKDFESFGDLYKLYHPRLKNYANQLLANEDEADDLVQEVFVVLWKNRSQLDINNNLSSYIFAILKNKCLNYLKHRVVEGKYLIESAGFESEELYHISFSGDTEFIPMEDALIQEMEKIILLMPEKCGVAFRLKWFEGKKIREIAEIMNISTTMVDKYLARGLKIARRHLSSFFFDKKL